MLTEELSAALQAATECQPFTPDPAIAIARARRARLRRRATLTAAALGLTALVGAGIPALLRSPGSERVAVLSPLGASGADPSEAPTGGEVPLTVVEDRAAEARPGAASCVLQLVLGPRAEPDHIQLPCEPTQYAGSSTAALLAPFGRQDRVMLDGRVRLVTSGTAPKGTVAVTAMDASGRRLNATLARPNFTPLVVFAMQSGGSTVTGLHYVLADGRRSEENTVSTP